MKKVKFSSKALKDAKAVLAGVSLLSIQEMVLNSARITHPQGNRRYKEYVFDVQDGTVQSVASLAMGVYAPVASCPQCGGLGKFKVWEECGLCDGAGCSHCNTEGGITITRPCSCTTQKYKRTH